MTVFVTLHSRIIIAVPDYDLMVTGYVDLVDDQLNSCASDFEKCALTCLWYVKSRARSFLVTLLRCINTIEA